MAIVIEAPNENRTIKGVNSISLFLAGGISNCEDWQSWVISELSDIDNLIIYNPRRKKEPEDLEEQIIWEFEHLQKSDIVLMWFANGSLNPITLYELGMWVNSRDNTTILGIDPQYERKRDVEIQTNLARPELIIFDSLMDIIDEIKNSMKEVNDTI